MSIFHSRLKELKESSELTQVKIAEQLGITPQAFSYIVNGREPNYDTLIKIASLFNVSTDWLLGLTDVKSVNADAKAVEAYVGLSEKNIKYFHDLISSPVNNGGEYISFINHVFEDPYFQLMLHNLFSLNGSVMGEALYWKLWDSIFPENPFDVCSKDEQCALEERFSALIKQVCESSNYSPRVLESLKIYIDIFNSGEHAASALVGAEGFAMSDIDEYRASKHLKSLIESIANDAEKKIKEAPSANV